MDVDWELFLSPLLLLLVLEQSHSLSLRLRLNLIVIQVLLSLLLSSGHLVVGLDGQRG